MYFRNSCIKRLRENIIVEMEDIKMNDELNSSVCVKVDVTKIVKYVCIAGSVIVAVIFGSMCFRKR